MTPKNFFSGLKSWGKSVVWTGTSNKVFGDSVFFVPDIPIQQMSQWRSPTLFIIDMGGSPSSTHPNLIENKFTLGIYIENVGDNFGESVMMSGNRVVNTSSGAGILDIEAVMMSSLIALWKMTSTKVMIVEKSKARTTLVKSNSPSTLRVWTFSVLLEVE